MHEERVKLLTYVWKTGGKN